jgi:hypothetical protein
MKGYLSYHYLIYMTRWTITAVNIFLFILAAKYCCKIETYWGQTKINLTALFDYFVPLSYKCKAWI